MGCVTLGKSLTSSSCASRCCNSDGNGRVTSAARGMGTCGGSAIGALVLVHDDVYVVTIWMPGWEEQAQAGRDGECGDRGRFKGRMASSVPSTPGSSLVIADPACPGRRVSS